MITLGNRPRVVFAVAAIICVWSAVSASPWAGASNGTKVPYHAPDIPAIKIACLTKDTHRYIGKIAPNGKCEIGGLIEASFNLFHGSPERLGKGGTFARFPIKGSPVNGTAWTDWGAYKGRGLARSIRDGHAMNLSAYRRVKCADGSAWYSRADVTDADTSHVFYLRLPVCGVAVLRGQLGTR